MKRIALSLLLLGALAVPAIAHAAARSASAAGCPCGAACPCGESCPGAGCPCCHHKK